MPARIKHPDKDSTTVQQSAIPWVLLRVAPFLQGSYTAIIRYSGCYADPHKHCWAEISRLIRVLAQRRKHL